MKRPVLLAFAMLALASSAFAQSAKFINITDAVPGRNFDAATTIADPAGSNRLIVGFNSGLDPKDFSALAFTAATTGFAQPQQGDALSFTVVAPKGYYVARVTYAQRGLGSATRTGKPLGATYLTVAGKAYQLGLFGGAPSVTFTADVAGKATSVPVTIASAIFAATGGSVSIVSADVFVDLLPL